MIEPASTQEGAGNAAVLAAERGVDEGFSQNALLRSGAKQTIWTLLSVAEAFLEVTEVHPIPIEQIHLFVDGLINELAYPIRVCFKHSPSLTDRLD